MASHAGLKAGDLIAFGYTHKPWRRELAGIHFVSAGSVGRPKDGDWRAGYVLVDVGNDAIQVESVRLSHDVERAAQGIRNSGLPEAFAEYLRTGGGAAPAPNLERCGTEGDDAEHPGADAGLRQRTAEVKRHGRKVKL